MFDPAGTNKKTLYVGGLSEEVTYEILESVFTPFGEVHMVQLPTDIFTGKHKGYGFIEFKEVQDAADAIDNMHESEIFGKTIRVNLAKPRGIDPAANKAIWHSEEWIKQFSGKTLENEDGKIDEHAKSDIPGELDHNAVVTQLKPNPTIFMDISIDGQYSGRMVFKLRSDIVPKTVENFRRLCIEKRGKGYKQCPFHRIIPGFMAQGGDFTNHDGTGGKSIYEGKFKDENFKLLHTEPGTLSMANKGPHTNGSQFFITFAKASWLDGKHVVFGNIEAGLETLKKIEAVGTSKGKPMKRVLIEDCGELK